MAERQPKRKLTGIDDFGMFWTFIAPPRHKGIRCENCESNQAVAITYNPELVFDDIDVARTILRTPNGVLGITCGCYSKFHRQIAHIRDSMRARSS